MQMEVAVAQPEIAIVLALARIRRNVLATQTATRARKSAPRTVASVPIKPLVAEPTAREVAANEVDE